MRSGHVFVIQGDLLRVAADGVLVPCDETLHVQEHWGRLHPRRLGSVGGLRWEESAPRVTTRVEVGGQVCRFVDSGASEVAVEVAWLREGVRQGLAALRDDVCGREAMHGRERPLMAMPLAGTGAGGFAAVRGEALAAVLEEARAVVAGAEVDVVIVCLRRTDYAALQSCRGDVDWPELEDSERGPADTLAEAVVSGELVLFLGAGLSRAVGLPDFGELLDRLGRSCSQGAAADLEGLEDLPERAARIVEGLEEGQVSRLLAEELQQDRHGVGHALLASLKVPEVVTTNFDDLFEVAARVPFEGQLQVVPWERHPGRRPWLLKAHGDAVRGSLVLTAEQYARFQRERGPVASVVQSLFLLSRHVLFVGYSLRDSNIRRLIEDVTDLLTAHQSEHRRLGTVLSIDPGQESNGSAHDGLPVVNLAAGGESLPEAARRLEVFLDRVAWGAARREASWLLDPTYSALLDPEDRALVERLARLGVPDGPRWSVLREALDRLGRPTSAPSGATGVSASEATSGWLA